MRAHVILLRGVCEAGELARPIEEALGG